MVLWVEFFFEVMLERGRVPAMAPRHRLEAEVAEVPSAPSALAVGEDPVAWAWVEVPAEASRAGVQF